MGTTRNTTLEAWMDEHGYSSNSLADAVNRAIEQLTGRPGGLDGSSVRDWKAGRVKWGRSGCSVRVLRMTSGVPACPECGQPMKSGGLVLSKREDDDRRT
jgi:hypothetical protein